MSVSGGNDYVYCPNCRSGHFIMNGEDQARKLVDPITDKSTEIIYREVTCLDCDYRGEYVPWRETSQGNSPALAPLPLTQPPPRSNAALILDSQRMVLASSESCGTAVYHAQSFEHAEYIVWCVGSVLKRVRTAQVETVKIDDGAHEAHESYRYPRYHHVWGEGAAWDEFWNTQTTPQAENT